ncbi:MAG: thioredoxin domain-containing protein [Actinomycetota bacterium]
MSDRPANRLAGATSPYLLQHAHNPVDWYPWGEEAFAKAAAEDKPVFLSVGYAACHWCHVMERESFEDETTAAILNERFVSIKVDREERPDVDGIYMDAVQAMNRGQGGWPMSVFCTPQGEPFFAGTYFPDEPRHGMPSFRQVLDGIADAWRDRRDEIARTGSAVTRTLRDIATSPASGDPLGEEIPRGALAALARSFDATWGGFGGAPKFPQPMVLEFLLRQAVRSEPRALDMAVLTLDRMAAGGMHDQVGGGFARYSTDARWHVPHFEKMLSDNAQLALVYTHAWLLTRESRLRDVTERILSYLLREMRHPEGGFFTSQDADSEGEEGRFFVWAWDDLVRLVGSPAAEAFGARPGGNWEGTNVLWHPAAIEDPNLRAAADDARAVLFASREWRVHPGTDDKVVTAWNGLTIRALAEAGRAFGEPTYVEAAERAAVFAWANLRDEHGRLLRSWRAGAGGPPGFADDHALLAAGFFTLYETTADLHWFEASASLCDVLIARFEDPEHGGFFQTADDAERLIVRPKELYDNAVPSGNSAAAEVLLRMALLTGDAGFERAAAGALRLVRDPMQQAPSGFGHALCALDLYLGPSNEIAIIGEPTDPSTAALVHEVVAARFLPNSVLAVASPDDARARSSVALLADRPVVGGAATAYVCRRFVCGLPVTRADQLAQALAP